MKSITLSKQERIEALLPMIVIEHDGTGCYAVVPSTTRNKKYIIDINEQTYELGRCHCEGADRGYVCIHLIATGVLVAASRLAVLNRVCDAYTHETVEATGESIESVVDEAETMLSATPDEIALVESEMHEDEKRARFAEWLLGDAYEVRGQEIAAKQYDGPNYCERCGNLCKGDMCGPCILGDK